MNPFRNRFFSPRVLLGNRTGCPGNLVQPLHAQYRAGNAARTVVYGLWLDRWQNFDAIPARQGTIL